MLANGVSGSWYAVHTRRQHEKVIAQILLNKGYEIFLPLYMARHKWSDRIKSITLPLFPGYMFVRERFGRWLEILTTPGVCGLVGCAGCPVAIPYQEIEAVRSATTTGVHADRPWHLEQQTT